VKHFVSKLLSSQAVCTFAAVSRDEGDDI
jgi:hypothetical protein